MFYKKEETGNHINWHQAKSASLPDGVVLTEEVRENEYGWFWADEEPEEYLAWKQIQNELDGTH